MACVLCTSSLNIFTRKKCSQCQRIHCSKCSHRYLSAGVCAFCFRLLSLSFNRQDLDQYTIKELRHFLIRSNHCTDNIKERADLVEAVMKLKCPRNQASDNAEHVRHVQQLKERMTRETSNDRSNASSSSTSPSSADDSNSASATSSMSSSSSPQVAEDNNTSSSPSAFPAELRPFTDRTASFTSTSRVLSEPPEAISSPSAGLAPNSDSAFGTPIRRMTLNQLSKEEDIDKLSVRQLKELLVTNYVDYKGCCERQELMERVRRLWMDDRKNKGIISEEQSSSEIDLCKICMDSVIDCILLECGHMVTCTQCGKRMAECPICRHYVSRVVHVFKA